MNELGVPALEVTPHDVNSARLDTRAGLLQIAEHAVVDQLFAQFDDLDVKMV